MEKNIQSVRGMNDYLPQDTLLWRRIEDTLKQVLDTYGYSEIRLPILEQTPLFKHAIGEISDVVEKEMYTFNDRNNNSLTLRPEGTAGCVRAGIEHGLFYNKKQRFWYMGPMFRYERPQKGRYRQFHQLGIEVFGLYGPDIDAEIILLTARCWKILGIAKYLKLELNSIGSLETRAKYRNALVVFLEQHIDALDEVCKSRLYNNPIRVLDSKNPKVQELLNNGPRLSQYLDKTSRTNFDKLCKFLSQMNISHTVNERLVRGLDYYNCTVFEWITTSLGAQGAVCAGGRYNNLVEQFGGPQTPAVGCAIGLDRLVLLVQELNLEFTTPPMRIDVYMIVLGEEAQSMAMRLTEQVRDELPLVKLMTNFEGGSFKKQITRANKFGARFALILGEIEMAEENVILKDLSSGKQEILSQSKAAKRLALIFM